MNWRGQKWPLPYAPAPPVEVGLVTAIFDSVVRACPNYSPEQQLRFSYTVACSIGALVAATESGFVSALDTRVGNELYSVRVVLGDLVANLEEY